MANGVGNPYRITDGQMDFSGGVNSDRAKTIGSQAFPGGLRRNQLSWLINGTVRTAGVSPRLGWTPVVQDASWSGIYQGGIMYQPDFNDPHLLISVGGELWRIRLDTDSRVENLSAASGLTMPPDEPQAFFQQAEMFAVWQSGDLVTNPIFYDFGVEGVRLDSMRRSNGFISVGNAGNEIPPAGPMDYCAQRIWYAFGRFYCAGDIALNQSSGTAAFDFRDSVIHVTENPVAIAGDGFVVPTTAGNIRALSHASNNDTALGESQMFVFTRRNVYACVAPITRTAWTAAGFDNMPLQKVILGKGGTYSDRSVVPVNQDIFYQSPPNGDIRSVAVSVRNDRDWGNVPLSRNVNRALLFNDRSMLRFSTGIEFDNRMLQSCLPTQTPAGVAFRGLLPLNFDLISSLEEKLPPAWEGVLEGLNILQLFEGDFGGRQRAFAVVWSGLNSQIEIWEITDDQRFDGGAVENRVNWVVETPAYNGGHPFMLKELETAELWLDKILGTGIIEVYYKPDAWPCWIPWQVFDFCAAKDCREDIDAPCSDDGYPKQVYCEQDRIPLTLRKPPVECASGNSRPSNQGFQFQLKLVCKGWFRIRGILVHMLPRHKPAFMGLAQTIPMLEERL